MVENELIENQEIRNKMIGRIDVLDKVGTLLLMPGTEFMNVNQVADYYHVGEEAIKSICKDHDNELSEDGFSVIKQRDFLKVLKEPLEKIEHIKGKAIVTFENGNTISVPNRGLRIFPKRAVLRIGMLLRDSSVAREVRTQLLNIEEKVEDSLKISDINEERKLAENYVQAVLSSDPEKMRIASDAIIGFKNRQISKMQTIVDSYNHLANSDGLMTMNDVSKEVGLGEFTLFSYLRSKKVLFYNLDRINIPYQRFVDNGMFEVKEVICPDGNSRPATRVTKKGLVYIEKLLRKDGFVSEVA